MSTSSILMILTVQRQWYTNASTCGELSIDGVFFCFTLEPRKDQSQGKPYCIPAATYKGITAFSEHFHELTPHILDVSGFTDIEIHPGNAPPDTHGCTVVGDSHQPDFVTNSRATFKRLMAELTSQFTINYIG